MENIRFKFDYKISEEEYLAFNNYFMLNSPIGKKALLMTRLSGVTIAILAVVIFFIAGAETGLILTEAVLLAVFCIIWIIRSKHIMLKNNAKSIKKLKESGKLVYAESGTLIFDDTSILEISKDSQMKTNYSLLERVDIAEDAIYIFFSAAQAYILPFESFKDEDEKAEFIEFINKKVV